MIMLNIELSDFCNARCYYCVNGQKQMPHPQRTGSLPPELYNKIFEEMDDLVNNFTCMPAADSDIYLRFCGVGEPLLNPNANYMISRAICFSQVKILAILSNGSAWNKEFVDSFIDSATKRRSVAIELVFSLDTIQLETQHKIKQLKNIGLITQQLLYLLDQISLNRLTNVHPIFQMIVLKENSNEVEEFFNFWKAELEKRGIYWRIVQDATYTKYFSETWAFIWFKCLDTEPSFQQEAIDLHRAALKRLDFACATNAGNADVVQQAMKCQDHPCEQKYKHVCSIMWYGINIAANGDVSPCCLDIDFKMKLGNVLRNSLSEMYLSEKMTKLRQSHISGEFTDYPMCRNCKFIHYAIPVCDADVDEYQSKRKLSNIF